MSLGLRYEGVGTLRFAPKGGRMNAADYIAIVTNTYLPDCNKFYGVPPSCVFMQDGASSHTANAARDFRAKKFPLFWGKKVWPPCSPDLNPLDFFAWGYLQAEVDKKKPKCVDTLKLATRQCVDGTPLEMVQKAMLNFYPRARLCIEAEGGQFKHKKFPKANPLFQFDVRKEGESESDEEGQEEDGEEGEQEE